MQPEPGPHPCKQPFLFEGPLKLSRSLRWRKCKQVSQHQFCGTLTLKDEDCNLKHCPLKQILTLFVRPLPCALLMPQVIRKGGKSNRL